jgi:hypothetical protein
VCVWVCVSVCVSVRVGVCVGVCVCVCVGGGVSILVLVIRHAKRMRRIILPSVARPVLPDFPTFSQNRHDFREKSY